MIFDCLRSQTKRFLLTVAAGTAASVILVPAFGIDQQASYIRILVVLADATAIPALVILCGCALFYLSRTGFFDILAYGLSRTAAILIPRRQPEPISYYEYKSRRRSAQRHSILPVALGGTVLLFISLFFTFLYLTV